MDWWSWLSTGYVFLLIGTSISIWIAVFKKVSLNPSGDSFTENKYFNEEQKTRLMQHYSRMSGTLGYWKNKAEMYKRIHYFCLLWTIPSAIIIPSLTPFIEMENFSKITVCIISTTTAVLLGLHRGLKVDDNLKAFRHGESEFYDLMRKLLDDPNALGNTQDKQIETYFAEVARIRRFVRNAETDNLGTIDDARSIIEKRRSVENENTT